MKLRMMKEELLKAINTTMKATKKITTNVLLESIYFCATENEVTMTGNNLDIAIKTKVCATIEEPGELLVSATLLSGIVKRLKNSNSDITLESKGDTLRIQSGRQKLTIPCHWNINEFPSFPETQEGSVCFSLEKKKIKDIFRRILFCASSNEQINSLMTGILFCTKNGCFEVAALDGFRLAYYHGEIGDLPPISCIIPKTSLIELLKVMESKKEEDVEIALSKNYVFFSFDETVFVSRLLEGQFYNIKSLLSSNESSFEMFVNKEKLQESLEMANILVGRNINARKAPIFGINKKSLVVYVCDESGNMEDTLDIVCDKEINMKIGFNHNFIMDVLNAIDDENIKMTITSSRNPILIQCEKFDDFIYLVLPIAIETKEKE